MKIKESYKNLFPTPDKPMIIQALNLDIRKLLSKNLGLTNREANIESRFILEHVLKVDHQYLIKNFDKLIETNKLNITILFIISTPFVFL